MTEPSTLSWSDMLTTARTGDLVLFHSAQWESEIIEIGTEGDYSHVGMIVRPDPSAPPMFWEESGVPIAADPDHHSGTPELHGGAQLGRLDDSIRKIATYGDHPYYRRLDMDRTPEFEHTIQELVTTYDGVPFPSMLGMAASWVAGHYLEAPAPETAMFCAQLVAFTLQRAGVLDTNHVPNYYSPSTLSAKYDHEVRLLNGATFAPEVPLQLPV